MAESSLKIPKELDEGDKYFELHYDFAKDYSLPSLVGAFFRVQGNNG
jgi:hypothetical protein